MHNTRIISLLLLGLGGVERMRGSSLVGGVVVRVKTG